MYKFLTSFFDFKVRKFAELLYETMSFAFGRLRDFKSVKYLTLDI